MLILGLGLLFAGYTFGLYGWILIQGYNISFAQLFIGPWPPAPGNAPGKSPFPSAVPPIPGGPQLTPNQNPANPQPNFPGQVPGISPPTQFPGAPPPIITPPSIGGG